MVSVWRWFKRWWWTFVAGAAAAAGFLLLLLIPKPKRDSLLDGPPPKTFKDRAQERVDRVRLEGEIEKARVKAIADMENQQLDEIEEIASDDPSEARKQLAHWLRNHL